MAKPKTHRHVGDGGRRERADGARALTLRRAASCGDGGRGRCALASARPSLAAPGAAEARGYVYSDNGGVRVTTAVASAVQRLPRASVVSVRAGGGLHPDPQAVLDPGDPGAAMQLTGHHHADAVTSASSTAGGGGVAEKWRFEGAAGVATDRVVRGAPAAVSLFARAAAASPTTSRCRAARRQRRAVRAQPGAVGVRRRRPRLGAAGGSAARVRRRCGRRRTSASPAASPPASC